MFGELSNVFSHVDPNYAPPVSQYQDIFQLFAVAINVMIGVGFSITLIVITYSAYLYIVSGGNPDKTKRAWHTFLYGMIAAAVTLGAVALGSIVLCGFGVDTTSTEAPGWGIFNECSGGGIPLPPGPGPPDPPDPVSPILGSVNPLCPCGGASGGCARTNQVAIGPGSRCYECTNSGWQSLSTTRCSNISCSPCP